MTKARPAFPGERWPEYWPSGGHLERAIGVLAGRRKWVGTFRRPALPPAVGGKQPAIYRSNMNCKGKERPSLAQRMGRSKACRVGRTPGSGEESRIRGSFRPL